MEQKNKKVLPPTPPSIKQQEKPLWAFCFQALCTARSEVLAVVTLRKNNICPHIGSKQAFFHISVRDTVWSFLPSTDLAHWRRIVVGRRCFLPSGGVAGVFHRSPAGLVPGPLSEGPITVGRGTERQPLRQYIYINI